MVVELTAIDEDEEDPAERLSELLESVSPTTTEQPGEPVDLDSIVAEESGESSRPRFAWPTPVDPDEADDAGADAKRESRYRSRSAQLPRLGNQAKSNMTTMANLRKKSRGSNDD